MWCSQWWYAKYAPAAYPALCYGASVGPTATIHGQPRQPPHHKCKLWWRGSTANRLPIQAKAVVKAWQCSLVVQDGLHSGCLTARRLEFNVHHLATVWKDVNLEIQPGGDGKSAASPAAAGPEQIGVPACSSNSQARVYTGHAAHLKGV